MAKDCTLPNSTVGKKITERSPYPTSTVKKMASIPLNKKAEGNFGTGNPPMGAKSPPQTYKSNFGTTPKNPRKGS